MKGTEKTLLLLAKIIVHPDPVSQSHITLKLGSSCLVGSIINLKQGSLTSSWVQIADAPQEGNRSV